MTISSSRVLLVLAALAAAPAGAPRAATRCHPIALAGGPYVAECSGTTTLLAIDGSDSFSCPGDPLTFRWTTDCPGGVIDQPNEALATLTLASPPPCPVACTLTLTVTNSIGLTDDGTATVTVSDTEPPHVVNQGPLACLWPADHRLVCFAPEDFGASAVDDCGDATLTFTACASSEPDDVPGGSDGHTTADCSVAPDGRVLCARAERDKRGSGREYTVTAAASDACGNTTLPQIIGVLRVPRSPDSSCVPTSH